MLNKGKVYLHDVRERMLQEAKKRLKRAGITNYTIVQPGDPVLPKLAGAIDWVRSVHGVYQFSDFRVGLACRCLCNTFDPTFSTSRVTHCRIGNGSESACQGICIMFRPGCMRCSVHRHRRVAAKSGNEMEISRREGAIRNHAKNRHFTGRRSVLLYTISGVTAPILC